MKPDVVERILGESPANESDRKFIHAMNTIQSELVALQKAWFSRPQKGTREHNLLWQHIDMLERDLETIRKAAEEVVEKP